MSTKITTILHKYICAYDKQFSFVATSSGSKCSVTEKYNRLCFLGVVQMGQHDGDQRGPKANTSRRKYKAKTIHDLVKDGSKKAIQGAFLQVLCVSTCPN
jgi:hypothetical protein